MKHRGPLRHRMDAREKDKQTNERMDGLSVRPSLRYSLALSARNKTRAPNNMQKLKHQKAKTPGEREIFSVGVWNCSRDQLDGDGRLFQARGAATANIADKQK